MIHIDRGGDKKATKRFFDKCNDYEIEYDVIGQSYYPWWHGSLDDLRENLAFMAEEYDKDIMLVEVAYNWRPAEYRNESRPISRDSRWAKGILSDSRSNRPQHAERSRKRHLLVGAGRAAQPDCQPRHVRSRRQRLARDDCV